MIILYLNTKKVLCCSTVLAFLLFFIKNNYYLPHLPLLLLFTSISSFSLSPSPQLIFFYYYFPTHTYRGPYNDLQIKAGFFFLRILFICLFVAVFVGLPNEFQSPRQCLAVFVRAPSLVLGCLSGERRMQTQLNWFKRRLTHTLSAKETTYDVLRAATSTAPPWGQRLLLETKIHFSNIPKYRVLSIAFI